MKKLNWSKLGVSLAELILGILLLMKPESLTSGIIALSGIVLGVYGIVCIIKYFRAEAQEAEKGSDLSTGLLCILGAVFCVVKRDWFVGMMHLLALLYGAVILLSGCNKFQDTVDILRQKRQPWIPSAVTAGVSLLVGLIIIFNPFKTTKALWIFTGIGLIAQAIADLTTFFMSKPQDEEEEQQPEGEKEPQQPQEETDEKPKEEKSEE